ncbi:GNAT family N-acetyltransferase [Chromobacterium phragmitis]|uniref:N-acetyltransferase n=1 Tax=Chromobacterium phragmitis TaxID=2202141 RepID=A0A344UPI1_9NEIS|nr:N-acetyltransferase [Chromobacterium phragmitis]AXE37179.1 hypothetical protein DK843_22790 [Chromobacterium phragmitis]
MAARIAFDDHDAIAWAAARIGCRPESWQSPRAIALRRADNTLAAAVIFERFSECDCNIHVASDGSRHWMTRTFLVSVFAYPFIQLGLRRITGLVPASNFNALRLNQHLGFEIEGYCDHAMPEDDIVVMGMTRARCRFIHQKGERNGF